MRLARRCFSDNPDAGDTHDSIGPMVIAGSTSSSLTVFLTPLREGLNLNL